MSDSRITRANGHAAGAVCEESWIGGVERCGREWIFWTCGSGSDSVETFVYASQEAAERARGATLALRGSAFGVLVAPVEE